MQPKTVTQRVLSAILHHYRDLNDVAAETGIPVARLRKLQKGPDELQFRDVQPLAALARRNGVDFADWLDGLPGTPTFRQADQEPWLDAIARRPGRCTAESYAMANEIRLPFKRMAWNPDLALALVKWVYQVLPQPTDHPLQDRAEHTGAVGADGVPVDSHVRTRQAGPGSATNGGPDDPEEGT